MTVLIGFLKALIVMLVFGVCYEYFVEIIYNMYQALITYGFNGGIDVSSLLDPNALSDLAWNLLGAVIVFVVALEIFLVYIGLLTRGLQIMILRLGMAFAAIGLLNADGGVFKSYLKKFLQNAFTVLVQIFLVQLTLALIGNNNFMLALITASVALKGASLLQEFLGGGTGAFGEQGLMSSLSTVNQVSMLGSKALKTTFGVAKRATASVVSVGKAGGQAVDRKVTAAAEKNPNGKAAKIVGAKQSVSNFGSKIGNKIGSSTVGTFGKDVASNYRQIMDTGKNNSNNNMSASTSNPSPESRGKDGAKGDKGDKGIDANKMSASESGDKKSPSNYKQN